MSRPATVCNVTYERCPELAVKGGKCRRHYQEARAAADRRRPNSTARGYDHRWAKRAASFLERHPWCVDCGARATVPDHDPVSRRELVRRGDPDPDADHHLKPRCASCHGKRTAEAEPGGWNV